jgi:hypothetical protein
MECCLELALDVCFRTMGTMDHFVSSDFQSGRLRKKKQKHCCGNNIEPRMEHLQADIETIFKARNRCQQSGDHFVL